MGQTGTDSAIGVVGDIHGHLQLALCVMAQWQRELGIRWEAILLCGDVGSFTADEQLDSTTRRHGKANPCELEFLQQWSAANPPEWLDDIFKSEGEGAQGIACPVIMVHGNHEGFAHLATLTGMGYPERAVMPTELPPVDGRERIRLLPAGWRVRLGSGVVVAGLGGIERGQRNAKYHPMAYLDDEAVMQVLAHGKGIDVLLTHQGPAALQGTGGSPTLDILLENEVAPVWCHGHSIEHPEITDSGPHQAIRVVPMGDIAFPMKGPEMNEPGGNGWAYIEKFDSALKVVRTAPAFLRDFRRHKWQATREGFLVCPPLVPKARRLGQIADR